MSALFEVDQNPLNILEQKKYNVKEAAALLDMSVNTLNKLCKRGDGPNELTIAGNRKFLEKELERWIIDQNPQLKEQFLVMESARTAMERHIKNTEARKAKKLKEAA
jgi:hypothetical protein